MFFRIHNLKFRNQIILVFLIIFILLSVGSGIAFYYISARQITDSFSSNSINAMGQIENTLETRLGIIDKRAETILINSSFSATISSYLNEPNSDKTVLAQGTVSDYLKDFERGEPLIDSSYLATNQMAFDSYVHYRRYDFDFWTSPFYTVYQNQSMKAVQWFGVMDNLIFQSTNQVIPCVRRFRVNGYQGWLYFVYQLNQRELKKLITGNESFFDDIIIIDGHGNQLLGETLVSSEELLELWNQERDGTGSNEGNSIILEDGTMYLVTTACISGNDWKVFGLKSQEELLESLRQLRKDIFKLMLFLFAVSMALISFIMKRLTDALNRLERQMACARNGDFSVRFFYPFKDEIGSLSESFNYMIEEVQNLINKQNQSIIDLRIERDNVAEMQKQKREAELKALQAQIKPHFLYNTLNAITWQAADKGMDDVSLMANSLGRFFRLSLNKGVEIISLSDEIEHVRSYLSIQGIRYQNRLCYEIDIPGDFPECRVLKLILQPLVENAIYHGIKEKKCEGLIRITAEKGTCGNVDTISLIVWDNGVGIPDETLMRMNHELQSGVRSTNEGYGVYNVNERIRLYYGDDFGLTYESKAGSYTKAILTIPFQCQEVKS